MSARTASASAQPLPFAVGSALSWVLIAVIGLTLLRVLLLFANDLQLYGDEAQYWSYGQELAFGYYSKPPMVGWLSRATSELGGFGEAWVRLAAPLLHGGTALLLFALARRLYDAPTALLAALGYVSLPAVSFGALVLSTDTPLLLFWVLGMLALWQLRTGGGAAWGVLLGLALGGGLLSKYAMGYLLLGLALYVVVSPAGRSLLRRPGLWLGLGVGLLLFAPNVWWNLQHGGATMAHVAENANLDSRFWRPAEGIAFLVSQFGVVGPVFFAAFLARLALIRRRPLEDHERFLLAFSLPVLLIILVQAFMAGANANWAATAAPAAVVLAVGWLLQLGRLVWIKVALALNAVAFVGLALVAVWPGLITAAAGDKPLQDLRGWRAFAQQVDRRAEACGCETVLLDHRFELAQLWYYAELGPARLRMWVTHDISNHYELTRPFTAPARTRTLYVTERPHPTGVLKQLGGAAARDRFAVPTGGESERTYNAYVVEPSGAASEEDDR